MTVAGSDPEKPPASVDYVRRRFLVPPDREDDLAAWLVAACGALGCEVHVPGEGADGVGATVDRSRKVTLDAWFPGHSAAPRLDPKRWPGVVTVGADGVAKRDWLEEYRARSRPFAVGGFWIDPRDEETAFEASAIEAGGRVALHVPAENAFGTGSHESTRLVLLWLSELDLGGLEILDVGCGSGILAFAVERLGAASVCGFDLDTPSVITARRNGLRNGCRPALLAGTAASLARRPSFDLLLVNVLPERVLGDMADLVQMLRPGGRLVSSGNLLTRRGELVRRFEDHGLRLQAEKADGEWVSFLFEREGEYRGVDARTADES